MNIIGKTLLDVNAALYDETVNGLLSGAISAAGACVDDTTAKRIVENLSRARIRSRCGCGQLDCFSYYFDAPEKPEGSVTYETVRFHARGEHLLHIDSDGDVYQVQRLYDLSDGAPWTARNRPPAKRCGCSAIARRIERPIFVEDVNARRMSPASGILEA